MTIIANIVAASGVPNSAEKNAAIPQSVAVRVSRSSSLKSFDDQYPIVPPI